MEGEHATEPRPEEEAPVVAEQPTAAEPASALDETPSEATSAVEPVAEQPHPPPPAAEATEPLELPHDQMDMSDAPLEPAVAEAAEAASEPAEEPAPEVSEPAAVVEAVAEQPIEPLAAAVAEDTPLESAPPAPKEEEVALEEVPTEEEAPAATATPHHLEEAITAATAEGQGNTLRTLLVEPVPDAETELASEEAKRADVVAAATLQEQQILQAATAALAHISNSPQVQPTEAPEDTAMEDVKLADEASPAFTAASPALDATHQQPPPSPFIMPAAASRKQPEFAVPHIPTTAAPTATHAATHNNLTTAAVSAAVPAPSAAVPSTPQKTSVSRAMSRSVPVTNAQGDVTRCPCGDNTDQEGFMIQCETCEIWQHGNCIGLTEKTTPEQYYCEQCQRDHPIHQQFRKVWGDRTPVKGKPIKPKSKKRPTDADAAAAAVALANAPPTPAPARAQKTKTPRARGDAATKQQPTADLNNTHPPVPPSNKRKRTAEEGTPKVARGAAAKKLDDVAAHSPDLTKRPRLEDQLPASAGLTAAAVVAPATPAPAVSQPGSGEYDNYPGSGGGVNTGAIVHDLAALAAELGPDASGADLTPAGSREARKIQRYIQMIQKMETNTSKKPTGRDDDTVLEGDEDEEMADLNSTLQPPPQPSQQMNQVYATPAAAREARAKLRAEKVDRQEADAPEDANAASAEVASSGTAAATAAAAAARDRQKKKSSARPKAVEESPALTPVEIRKLRLAASSQLRPLGPMYFGRKQLLLQSYRDESLRCETGWAVAIHEELPMPKRVVHNYRVTSAPTTSTSTAAPHHHHSHPPSIFPASHPWSIRHVPKSKAVAKRETRPETEETDAASDIDDDQKPKPMEIDAQDAPLAPAPAPVTTRTPTPPITARAASPASTVKLESAAPLPRPEAFFASINTTALPSKIQSLIHSFSASLASNAANLHQPPPMPAPLPVIASDETVEADAAAIAADLATTIPLADDAPMDVDDGAVAPAVPTEPIAAVSEPPQPPLSPTTVKLEDQPTAVDDAVKVEEAVAETPAEQVKAEATSTEAEEPLPQIDDTPISAPLPPVVADDEVVDAPDATPAVIEPTAAPEADTTMLEPEATADAPVTDTEPVDSAPPADEAAASVIESTEPAAAESTDAAPADPSSSVDMLD